MFPPQGDEEDKKLLADIRDGLLSPRARKLQSTNFALSVWAGVFVGLAASAFVSFATIYFELEGKVQNNVSFTANVVMCFACAVISSSLYKRYKVLNEVQDFDERRYQLSSKLRPYDFLRKLQLSLEDSELKTIGHSFELTPEVQQMKGVKGGTIHVKRADYILFGKTVAKVTLADKELKIKYALDVEGDTALAVITSKLKEMEEGKMVTLEIKETNGTASKMARGNGAGGGI